MSASIPRPRRLNTWLACIAIFALGLTVFLVGVDAPAHPYFDEVHYLPAARQLLAPADARGKLLNPEHPPLAKELIALGIRLWGDNALGWRFMSAVFGALALLASYLWALALFGDPAPARWTTAITLVDQFLYVEARIATLDVFNAAFIVAALATFTATWRPGAPVRTLMLATSALLALATACKWTGLFAVAFWLATLVTVAVLQRWRTRFEAPEPTDWFRPDLWAAMRPADWVLCIAVVPLAVYAATFLPITGLSLPDILRAQVTMWREQSTLDTSAHPYASAWITWPALIRPIWFLFEPAAAPGRFLAIICLGNPVVLWGGIPAMLACLATFIRARRADAFLICGAYASLYVVWAILPRGSGFLYYYFPAGLVAGPALAFVFYGTRLRRHPAARWLYLVLAAIGFLYFLPITSTAVTTTLDTFNSLMWFPSWR